MNSATSSEPQQILNKAMTAGLNRWKIETLTGLLGFRSLQHHQSESEKNLEAENKRVRQQLWGDESSEEMAQQGHTILGDYNPPQVIMAGGHQSSGTMIKVIAGAAIAAGLIGIPAAGVIGYAASQLMDRKSAPVLTQDNSLDVGLGHIEDLLPASDVTK